MYYASLCNFYSGRLDARCDVRLLAARAPLRDVRPAARSAVRHHEHLAPHLGQGKHCYICILLLSAAPVRSRHSGFSVSNLLSPLRLPPSHPLYQYDNIRLPSTK